MANKLAEQEPGKPWIVALRLTVAQARELRDVIDRCEAINMAMTGAERQALGYVSQQIHDQLRE